MTLVLSVWWLTGTNGEDLVAAWWDWASGVQQALFSWIPFPWGRS